MTALKYEQALQLNGTDFRRRIGVNLEAFAKMKAVSHDREASKGKSGVKTPNVAPCGGTVAGDAGILAAVSDVLPPGSGCLGQNSATGDACPLERP